MCPFNDGRHKKKPWFEKDAGGRKPLIGGRHGLSCVVCHKTWEADGSPTWKDA